MQRSSANHSRVQRAEGRESKGRLNSATCDRVEQWLRHPAWGPWLKLVLFAALAAALVHQVIHRQDWAEAWTAMRQSGAEARWPLLLLVLALVPFNWGLEAEKWRRLISPLERIGFRRALRATLSGVTLGLFTPNRIGEYGGRVWYLSPGRRMAAVPLSLMGSWAQILVTGMLGALSGILFYYRFARIQQWPFLGKPVPWLMAIAVLSLVALVAYLLFPLWIGKVGHWSWWKRLPRTLRPPLRLLESLHPALLGQAFGLSAARYLVFAAQYLILLRVFNLALGWGQGFVALGTLFLMQSLLPSLSAFEWLKRGNLALFVFGVFIPDSAHAEWSILAASTGLWAINLVLPALLGYAFLLGQSGAPKQLPTKHPFSATPSAAASAAATHAPHRSPSNALPESAQTPSAARRSGEGKARPEARP